MAQTKLSLQCDVKSQNTKQIDTIITNQPQVQTSIDATVPIDAIVPIDTTESSEHRENWTADESQLAQLYQVDQLINRKYKKIKLTGTPSQTQTHPLIPFRQIVEMAMLFKVSSETEFFRRLQMTETGRLFSHQIENCLQTLQITLEMSPEAFQSSISHLTQESKDKLLNVKTT